MQTTIHRRAEMIAHWLRVFIRPGQVTELRALHVAGKQIVTAVFNASQVEDMAALALRLENDGAKGVYFTPNPLRPDMAISKRAARDDDVIARHWLLIDSDPIRFGPAGGKLADQKVSATDLELQAAWEVLDRCRATLDGAGFHGAVVGFSGNGWHLCYPIDLPNDNVAKEKVRQLLHGLKKRCGDSRAQIDTTCFNASRIWKLYGTKARKGTPTAERPHREARLVEWSPS